MVNSFERLTVTRLLEQAQAAGVDVPPEISKLGCQGQRNGGAVLWLRAHPDYEGTAGCCWGDALDPDGCTCWVPVFDVDQHVPVPPGDPGDMAAQRRMCGDCAYRKGSPERATPYAEETLFDLAISGQVFYCHDGMRRPARWDHPDGRTIDGSPDDWQPPIIAGIPYRADGRPGLLCAGWAARATRATAGR